MTVIDWQPVLDHADTQLLIDLALREDIGAGDVTTQAIFRAPKRITAHVVARTPTVLCGRPLVESIVKRLDLHASVVSDLDEGALAPARTTLMSITCDVRALLTAERTLLNFVMRTCGVAANAKHAVDQIPAGVKARVYDTRKTLPGWRRVDKLAVRAGGGTNHRIGLFDGILIKDNHIAAAGSISQAISAARSWSRGTIAIEVEIDRLDQLSEALNAKADIILLDNFTLADMREAVTRVDGKAELEASGGVSYERISEIAATGVDRISLGALTHSVMPADIGLDIP